MVRITDHDDDDEVDKDGRDDDDDGDDRDDDAFHGDHYGKADDEVDDPTYRY